MGDARGSVVCTAQHRRGNSAGVSALRRRRGSGMPTQRRGPGRPPGTQYGARLAPLALSPGEKRSIEQAAEAAGLPASEWLRRAAAYCVAARIPLAVLTVGRSP